MWRKIQLEDLKRGTIVRIVNIEDGYNIATILSVRTESGGLWVEMGSAQVRGELIIKLARPYAYAHENFNDNSPLLSCEVFDVSSLSMLRSCSWYEVYQGRDAVRSMVT